MTAAAVAGVWGWSIVDAGRAAHRTNVRRGWHSSTTLRPAVSLAPRGGTRPRMSLAVSVATR